MKLKYLRVIHATETYTKIPTADKTGKKTKHFIVVGFALNFSQKLKAVLTGKEREKSKRPWHLFSLCNNFSLLGTI